MSTVRSIRLYVTGVSIVGITAFFGQLLILPDDLSEPGIWVLGALVVLSEVFPIQVRRSSGAIEEITTSTTFSFALLLLYGSAIAVLAQGVASLADDLIRRKSGAKTVFNIAQYSIALVAAGAAFDMVIGRPDHPLEIDTSFLVSVLVAAGVFFFVNNALIDIAIALEERRPLLSALSGHLGFQAFTDAVLLGLAPIAAVTTETHIALVPLLVLPIIAVARGATSSLKNAALADELRNTADEMRHQATHDFLTQLPNRTLFLERVASSIAQVQGTQGVAVLLMDVDRFKEINDTLGHHNGDILLQQVGTRLSEELGEGALVARMGGDEFATLVVMDDETEAVAVARRVLQCFEQAFTLNDFPVEIAISIGMSVYPQHGVDPNALVQRADVAMYQAKESRTGFAVYVAEHDPYSLTLLSLVPELRAAVEDHQLVLHYQPIVEISSGRVLGVEALLRWDHPRLGWVPPDEFIPIAERTGLIKQITTYVLNEAMQQFLSWRREAVDLYIAVNLSPNSLHDVTLTSDIGDLLATWNVPPDTIELEITESALMSDPVRAGSTLNELTQMGLKIAIDDFGTGYSSLSRLRELPVSTIKIDRSFTLGLPGNVDDTAIVRSTIDLAHNLGLIAIAEGVESETVWQRLAQLGCDLVQGNFISRPVPAENLGRWLRNSDLPARGPMRPRASGDDRSH